MGRQSCQKALLRWVINMPPIALTKTWKKVQFRECYTRQRLAQFAFAKFAQQNYETVTNQNKRCRQKVTMLYLKTHFSPLVSQFYPGKFYYENIEDNHGQTQANSDSWSYWNLKCQFLRRQENRST